MEYAVSDDEIWRLQRLIRVKQVLDMYVDCYKYDISLIEKMKDHEGTLIIDWKKEPINHFKDFIKKLWELENEYCIEHNF